MAAAFLTGKYRRGAKRPENARRADKENQFLKFDEEQGFDIIDELEKIAKNQNATVAQCA